jgi:hypothetical protein
MDDLSDLQIDQALERGLQRRETEPRALRATYDRELGLIVVDLINGCSVKFPTALVQGLETASSDQVAEVEVQGLGYGLHWESLDLDLSVPGLMAELFGTMAYMARKAGQTTSEAKAAASRRNGAMGGRPKKIAAEKMVFERPSNSA